MQHYILRRKVVYTELIEVVVKNWDEAVAILYDESTEFEKWGADLPMDTSIEYVGETETT